MTQFFIFFEYLDSKIVFFSDRASFEKKKPLAMKLHAAWRKENCADSAGTKRSELLRIFGLWRARRSQGCRWWASAHNDVFGPRVPRYPDPVGETGQPLKREMMRVRVKRGEEEGGSHNPPLNLHLHRQHKQQLGGVAVGQEGGGLSKFYIPRLSPFCAEAASTPPGGTTVELRRREKRKKRRTKPI